MPKRNATPVTKSRKARIIEMYSELLALNMLCVMNVPTKEQVRAMTDIQVEVVRREAVSLQRALMKIIL